MRKDLRNLKNAVNVLKDAQSLKKPEVLKQPKKPDNPPPDPKRNLMQMLIPVIVVVIGILILAVMAIVENHEQSAQLADGQVQIPYSSETYKDLLCDDVVSDFQDAGFTNVTVEPIADLVTGWLTKDGEIESITVNGEDTFSEDDIVDADVPVIIQYHTFGSEEEKSDTTVMEEPTPEVTETPTSEPTPEESITVDSDAEFQSVMSCATDDYNLFESFASSHIGSTIEFNGHVDYLDNFEDYDTRWEMLVTSGDWDGYETVTPGPIFKMEDFNLSEIQYNGDRLGIGTNIHVVAKVKSFNRAQGLFYLDPVKITER